jgi:hypothetical protein
MVPCVAKRCSSHASQLAYAYVSPGSGISEFDDDQVSLRGDTLIDTPSYGSNCCTVSIVIGHVFRRQYVLIGDERRDRKSESIGNHVLVDSPTCRRELLKMVGILTSYDHSRMQLPHESHDNLCL